MAAAASNVLPGKTAQAQLLDRYFPANVPAYQDWGASATSSQIDLGYAPLGIRLGSFTINPSVDEAGGYETDPFGTGSGGSAIEQTNASLTANSNWSRNSLNADVSVSNTHYFKSGQSITDWTAATGGTVQVADDILRLGYAHVDAVELPTEIGAFAQQHPISDQIDDLRASYTFGPGRLSVEPALQGDIYSFGTFGNIGSADAGGLFDRDAATASLTANYQFAGGHNLLAIVSDSTVQYAGQSPLRPANYNDLSILLGIEYRSSAVLAYRALVGYEERTPTSRGTTDATLAAPAAELDLIWNPTALTSVTGKISQSFQNGPTDGGQGIAETSLLVAVDHSLSRTLDFHASARLIRASFPEGEGHELGAFATVQGNLHVSRHVVLSAEYDFSEEDGTNQTSLTFRNHEVFLRGRLQW